MTVNKGYQIEKIKKQILQKLNEMLQKRLKSRIQQKLSNHYTNCQHSTQLNRFYICSHEKKLTKDSYQICSQHVCSNCCFYCNKYKNDKNVIEQEFYKDINDPAICGNKQPKIAMLIWVLKLFSTNQINKNIIKQSLWSKIKLWIKNGFVSK